MKKLLAVILLPLLALITLTACGTTDEQPEPLTLTQEDFPRMDGSTANIPLAQAAAAVLMGIDRAEAAAFVNFNGTDRSYHNLLAGFADILLVYPPSEDTRRNNNFNLLNKAPIGSDALVFIVNAANPVTDLTLEQVRAIYTGEITNWSQVGGEDAPIAPFQRNPTAGSHALMMSLLMQDAPMMPPKQHLQFGAMGAMLTGVADFDAGRYSIGYHVFFYVAEMMANPNVRILSVNGVTPTQATISSGEYPLTANFYAVIRANEPEGSPAYKMFHWLQSPEGQALIKQEGYGAK